jgi:3-carboxy-cis,cis-muconate cycloisomerase
MPHSSSVFDTFLGHDAAAAHFAAPAWVAAMLEVERAWVQGLAQVGAVPAADSDALLNALRAAAGGLDAQAIAAESTAAGTLVVPFLKHLRAALTRCGLNASALGCLHLHATSQDILDMALALQIRRALQAIEASGKKAALALLTLARTHRSTPMLARTLMQPAACTSLGLKCAQWLAPLARSLWAIAELKPHALRVQIGGAAGNQLVLRRAGVDVAAFSAALAAELGLSNSPVPMHTQSDALMRLAAEAALLVGGCGKVAGDVALMSQFEVAEAFEAAGEGKGTSSAMPHKRNPAGCLTVLAAAQSAPNVLATMLHGQHQAHERALGGWQVQLAQWPHLLSLVDAAISSLAGIVGSLDVRTDRMLANLRAVQAAVGPEATLEFFDESLAAHSAALCDAQLAALQTELQTIGLAAPQ